MIANVPAINVALLFISGFFCLLFPIALMIIWKVKNRSARLIAVLAGAVTFIAWALFLEQMLHMVMLPLVQGTVVLYTVYGTLAAGIFEETGRFVTYKLFLRKTTAEGNPADSVMYGIGHGGIEAVMILSLNLISYGALAALINAGQGEELLGAMLSTVPRGAGGSGADPAGGISPQYADVLHRIVHRACACNNAAHHAFRDGVCGGSQQEISVALPCVHPRTCAV